LLPPISTEAYKWVRQHELAKVLQFLNKNAEYKLMSTFSRALFNAAKDTDQRRAVISYVSALSLGHGVHLSRILRQKGIQDITLSHPIPSWIKLSKTPKPSLILSVIRQESNFDIHAKSPVGALGLMQIMPRTARREARIMNRPLSLHALSSSPNVNVSIGSHYLQRLLNSFNGHPALALAAYNAGAKNVSKWIKTYGDPRTGEISTLRWMESIPFKETRNYVQRILENQYIYKHVLEKSQKH